MEGAQSSSSAAHTGTMSGVRQRTHPTLKSVAAEAQPTEDKRHAAHPAAGEDSRTHSNDVSPHSKRNLLESPAASRDSSVYRFLFSSNGDAASGTDDRTQDELAASPTYSREFLTPHNKDPDFPLYSIEQVPYYLRDNEYVTTSYRAYYSTRQCVMSLFRLHNETMNIWTHLLGGVVFLVMALYLFAFVLIPEYRRGNSLLPEYNERKDLFRLIKSKDGQDRTTLPFLIFGFYSFSCLMCMLCSTLFHLFLAHISEHFYGWAHAFDYFGITFLVVGSFLPFCYYLFLCQPQWCYTYISMICCFGTVGLLGPFFRRWTSVAFAKQKIVFYVCFVGSGMLPITHLKYLPHNVGSPYVFGLLQMMFLYGFGVFIYAFKVPEIFFPGRFDVFFSSHQIWHVCVFGAALTHFLNCVKMYTNVENIVCDAK